MCGFLINVWFRVHGSAPLEIVKFAEESEVQPVPGSSPILPITSIISPVEIFDKIITSSPFICSGVGYEPSGGAWSLKL